MYRTLFLLVLGLELIHAAYAQPINELVALRDADSVYIRTFARSNDLRLFYGGQGNRLVIGSVRDGSPDLTRSLYNNTNDYIGIGATYKWLDGDLTFSIPGTTYLNEERSNLDQFRLSAGFSQRKITYRGYLSDRKGVVISGNNNEYQSPPSLHEFRMGIQATYNFNAEKYSYRATLYQSERQMKTAGAFLLRVEPFYRNIGANGETLVPEPYDTQARFGELTGLTYVKAPGLIVMPGYGVNFVIGKSGFFVSPIVLAGAGLAFNRYGSDRAEGTRVNLEYSGYLLMNAGYNGGRWYSRIQCSYAIGYSPIEPAYLTSNDLNVSLLIGYRFRDLSL
jgi:hypothetical protein